MDPDPRTYSSIHFYLKSSVDFYPDQIEGLAQPALPLASFQYRFLRLNHTPTPCADIPSDILGSVKPSHLQSRVFSKGHQ